MVPALPLVFDRIDNLRLRRCDPFHYHPNLLRAVWLRALSPRHL